MATQVIEKLLLVQDHDQRILKFDKELADLPQRKAAAESMLGDHQKALVAAKDAVKSKQAEIKQAELEVESHREKIRKFREQQLQLKSNKEFRAMEDEIANVERNIKNREDQMLEIMEALDAAVGTAKQQEQALKQEEEVVKGEIKTMEDRAESVRQELARVKASRAQAAAEADPERLALYERLFTNKKDRVLVPVEHSACGGCHMKLPPYVCHEAKKQAVPVFCDFCGRMLY